MSHDKIARHYPGVMKNTAGFNARAVRETLIRDGGPAASSFIRYAYRPFDNRWLYWEADQGLLGRPRADYRLHVFVGNLWVEAREREAKEDFSRGTTVPHFADNFGNGLSSFFPAWLRDDAYGKDVGGIKRSPNLSAAAQRYLDRLER